MIQHCLHVFDAVGYVCFVFFGFQRCRQRLPWQNHSHLLYLILDLNDFIRKGPISTPEHTVMARLVHLLLPGGLLCQALFRLRLEVFEGIFFGTLLNVIGNPRSFQRQSKIDCIHRQNLFKHAKAHQYLHTNVSFENNPDESGKLIDVDFQVFSRNYCNDFFSYLKRF